MKPLCNLEQKNWNWMISEKNLHKSSLKTVCMMSCKELRLFFCLRATVSFLNNDATLEPRPDIWAWIEASSKLTFYVSYNFMLFFYFYHGTWSCNKWRKTHRYIKKKWCCGFTGTGYSLQKSFSQMVYWLQGSGDLNDKTGKLGGEMMGRQMDDM